MRPAENVRGGFDATGIDAPGTSWYYSLRNLDPQRRAAVVALHQIARAVAAAGRSAEPAVAAARLDWWRQEIDRLFDDPPRPQHPAGVALAAQPSLGRAGRARFDELLAAADRDRLYDVYPDFAALQSYCHLSGAALYSLCGRALTREPDAAAAATDAFTHPLGIMLKLTELLAATREHALDGKYYLPEDELRRFHIGRDELQNARSTPQLAALFALQAQRIRDYAARAQTALPARQASALRPLRVYATLKLAWLDTVAADDFPLLRERTRLTPLRKLWLAWRTR